MLRRLAEQAEAERATHRLLLEQAQEAIEGQNGQELMGHELSVGWAFQSGPSRKR